MLQESIDENISEYNWKMEQEESRTLPKLSGDYSKNTSDYSRKTSEYSKDAADYSRNPNEYSKNNAEYTRNTNDYSKNNAEYPRNTNEYSKNNAEYSRNTNEYSKNNAEYSRNTMEYSKNTSEYNRNATDYSRKISHDILSRESALNERYFEQQSDKVRSRSLDNLLGDNPAPQQTKLADLGLSQSRLNDRYHSVERLGGSPSVTSSKGMEQEYGGNRAGPSRYIKSQYAGKRAPAGSQSSRAYIEKSSEFGGVR